MPESNISLFLATLLGLIMMLSGPVRAEGDAARGMVQAQTCLGCHGIEGYKNAYPTYRVPMLGGQTAEYIVMALKAYKRGERRHDTMQAQAATMTDQDMEDVAAYFASFGEPLAEPDTPPVGIAPKSAAACVDCHSHNGVSVSPEYPHLAGQHESYLARSLYQYKKRLRQNAIMAGIVTGLSEHDIPALAKFYAAQRGLFTTKH